MKIIQVLPYLAFGDAVGNDAIALKKIISEKKYETQIYAHGIDNRLPACTALLDKKIPKLDQNDILIYHEAIASDLVHKIQMLNCRKVMIYHNITPPSFFIKYDQSIFIGCQEGYTQLKNLTNTFDMILSDSAYNRQNLVDMGFTAPNHVLPILIPFDDYKKKPSEKIIEKYGADGYTNILFVGRVVPNKCQHDIIAAFNEYQKHFNPKSRLFIVGSFMERYSDQLKEYTKRLGTNNVIFTGHTKFDEILAYYHIADLFLCQSEHEGFCVPLVEAMHFDVPIVAYDSSAIGETLGGSGFLLKEKNSLLTAGVMNRILTDDTLRHIVLENQHERLKDFQYDIVKKLFWKYMDEFISEKF
ncbi:MAG: glycosyltransferase family 4 protein [Treponema sp.]|nr:glycosyltransferase family 4 protein [Treponema sp.]